MGFPQSLDDFLLASDGCSVSQRVKLRGDCTAEFVYQVLSLTQIRCIESRDRKARYVEFLGYGVMPKALQKLRYRSLGFGGAVDLQKSSLAIIPVQVSQLP